MPKTAGRNICNITSVSCYASHPFFKSGETYIHVNTILDIYADTIA